MDRRFLRYYEEELRFLRDLGGEFARAHPAIAGRLLLDESKCEDPYVERLLEGAAFLTARVQLKQDAEFQRFTEHLLSIVYPDFLAPTPSMALVRLEPDPTAGDLQAGYIVPRGTRMASRLGPKMQTRCVFTTAHDVTLWPLQIEGVRYLAGGRLASLGLPPRREVRAALVVTLATTGTIPFQALRHPEKGALDRLVLHLVAGSGQGFRLYETLLGHTVGIVARPAGQPVAWSLALGPDAIRRKGFSPDEALLPRPAEAYDGYRILREYFTLPERFLFVEVTGLGPVAQRHAGDKLELVVLLDQADAELEGGLTASDLALFVTPAVNLFEKTCEPVLLDPTRRDFEVVVDRLRPLDYEVHGLVEVVGEGGGPPQSFLPFYALADPLEAGGAGAYYTLERRPRLPSEADLRRGQSRSSYLGGEVFLSVVDGAAPPWRDGLKRLQIRALCTNRDLPLFMTLLPGESHFGLESGAPVAAVRCLGEPTTPRPSLAQGEPAKSRPGRPHGETAWRLVSHLALNYLSLAGDDTDEGAAALRELLALYADFAEPAVARQVEGVRRVASRPVVDRLPGGGPITFGRGLEIELTLEERPLDRGVAFLLGAVLEDFFRRHAALNTFTRTVVSTLERGEIMRWPARIGRTALL